MNILSQRPRILGRFTEAELLLRQALPAAEQLFGSEHSRTQGIRSNLGLALGNLGSLDEALEVGRDTLEIARVVLGVTHPETLAAGNNYAVALKKKGEW